MVTWYGKRHSDGTYFYWRKENDDTWEDNHVHFAPDGTLLSVKRKGEYLYNRRVLRKQIKNAAKVDLPLRWGPDEREPPEPFSWPTSDGWPPDWDKAKKVIRDHIIQLFRNA